MKSSKILVLITSCLLVVSCASKNPEPTDRISVGKVQREIKVGMSSAEVIQALGSPNMVTTDAGRREVWTYDKVATEYAHKEKASGLHLILAAFGSSSKSGSSNQRTLTIVIKFDEHSRVRDFSYHTSTF